MTTPSNSPEPTMDEILASIRRIVSDEPVFGGPSADRRGVNPLIEPKSTLEGAGETPAPAGMEMWRPINRPPLPQQPTAASTPALSSSAPALPPGMPPLTSVAPPGSAGFDADLDDLLDDVPPKQPEPALPPLSAAPPAPPRALPPQDDVQSRWNSLRAAPSDASTPARPVVPDAPNRVPEPAPAASLPPSPPPFLPSFGTTPPPPRSGGFFPPPPRELPKVEANASSSADGSDKSLDELIADMKAVPASTASAPPVQPETAVSASIAAPAPLPPPGAALPPVAPTGAAAPVRELPKAEPRPEPVVEAPVVVSAVAAPVQPKEEPAARAAPPAVNATQAPEAPPAAPLSAPPAAPTAAVATADPAPRTLEDVVSDMVRPMLEKWIADNMPRIVEKALRGEMKK